MHLIQDQAVDTIKDGVRGLCLSSSSIYLGFCSATRTLLWMRKHLRHEDQYVLTSVSSQPVLLRVNVSLVRKDQRDLGNKMTDQELMG